MASMDKTVQHAGVQRRNLLSTRVNCVCVLLYRCIDMHDRPKGRQTGNVRADVTAQPRTIDVLPGLRKQMKTYASASPAHFLFSLSRS
jgi:hypothetical protein